MRTSASLCGQHQPMLAVASARPCSACMEEALAFTVFAKDHKFGHPGVTPLRRHGQPSGDVDVAA